MSAPDFNQKTIDTLAKRASYRCSNPDCRRATVGPNADPTKSTLIGEAAHINGARPQSKRYISSMIDAARAEITNGIWLCRNCHKLIDADDIRYTSNLLFAWREKHESFVLSELGNITDRIHFEQQNILLSTFDEYPPIIHRIVIDKPDGWEWRLAAELMRYFNNPHFKKIKDLRNGYYIKSGTHVDEGNILDWIGDRLNEASKMASPIVKLLDRLTLSFGKPGESGDAHEIHHVCILIRDYIAEAIKYEETLYFATVPDKARKAVDLLKDCWGSQVEKLNAIPETLDEVVALLNTEHEGTTQNPKRIQKIITFEVAKDWDKKMQRELKKLRGDSSKDHFGCSSIITLFVVIFVIVIIF